jgi:putative ABC transport system permease protein
MSRYWTDLRQSARIFRRSPGLVVTAVVALAMGIGFTTTMFAIVHGGTRGLPVPHADRVMAIVETAPELGPSEASVPVVDFVRWSDALQSFSGLAGYRLLGFNLASDGVPPARTNGASVTANAFDLLGASVDAGRGFTIDDARSGATPVAIVSDELRRARFAASFASDVVGRTIRLNGVPHTIVGVMPAAFGFPLNARVWVPAATDPAATGAAGRLQVFGRLRNDRSIDQANEEIRIDLRQVTADEPATGAVRGVRVFPFTETETPAEIRRALNVLIGVVSLALLIACANVANLLLARAVSLSRDTAIRSALGASRRRLITQQLGESALLAGVATIIGLGLAWLGLRFFALASASILEAYWVDFRLDAGVVGFAACLGLAAAVAAGLLPALRASSAGVGALLQQQSRAATGLRIGRLGRGLVIAQLTLACGLLVVTATFVRQAGVIRAVALPFPADRVVTAQLGVPESIAADPDARHRLLARLRDGLAAEPGLTRPAFVSVFPGRGAGRWSFSFADETGGDASRPATSVMIVTPEFFDLAGARVLSGRSLTWQDDERSPLVATVNESFARRFSAGRDPIGRGLRLSDRTFTIVGVVPDLQMQDVEDPAADGFYLSMLQARPNTLRLMAATAGPPTESAPLVREAVARVDPDLPAYEFASLRDAVHADKRILDAVAGLFLCFGLGALFLAAIGLYAILSFNVTSRTREFGIRMALGATRRDLARLVINRSAVEVGAGLGSGLLLAIVLSRVMAAVLERVPPAGPDVFLAIVLTMTVGTSLALVRPLARALALTPVDALRRE